MPLRFLGDEGRAQMVQKAARNTNEAAGGTSAPRLRFCVAAINMCLYQSPRKFQYTHSYLSGLSGAFNVEGA